MFPGTSYGDTVQDFKKVEIQHLKQIFGCPICRFPFAPCVKGSLSIPENFVYRARSVQFFINEIRIAFIRQRQLVLQIIGSVIDWRCRKHQHLCFDTLSNHFIKQCKVTIFFFVILTECLSSIAEIMGLINDNQIIIAPVQSAQICSVGLSMCAVDICMIKDLVVQPILSNRVVDIIVFVCIPVVPQFFRTENQNGFIPVLIIFNHCKCGKCFTKAHTIRQNTAIVLFKFIDYCQGSIPLEIIQHTPDFTVFESSSFIGQDILRNIL